MTTILDLGTYVVALFVPADRAAAEALHARCPGTALTETDPADTGGRVLLLVEGWVTEPEAAEALLNGCPDPHPVVV
jgi:hypothetical protein